MTLDAVHFHLLERQAARQASNAGSSRFEHDIARDPEDIPDDRRPERAHGPRQRLGRLITRLGYAIQGTGPETAPTPSTTRT